MKIYRGTDGDIEPIEMECDIFGYPNKTTNGETMFENTHFKTEAEAWKSILASVKAGIMLVGGGVRNAEEELGRLRKQAGDRAKAFEEAHMKYDVWKMENSGK